MRTQTPLFFIALALSGPLISACSSGAPAPAKAAAPAHVDAPRPEGELTTVKLSPEAVKRLGIETAVVRIDTAAATRSLGGEVQVPEGRMVTVTAPLAGTLSGVSGVQPGARVTPRRPADDARASDLVRARSKHRSAPRRRGRESRRRHDPAPAAAARTAAEGRGRQPAQRRGGPRPTTGGRSRAERRNGSTGRGAAGPGRPQGELAITAPLDGVVQSVSVAAGQTVAAAAPLLQIAQVTTLWVRVPISAGSLDQIDTAQAATVTRLGNRDSPRQAKPIPAPLKADPTAASVDLYYELSRTDVTLRPGERVMIELPLRSSIQGLVVPEASVLYDIHGDAWVSEDLGENAYARRRVADRASRRRSRGDRARPRRRRKGGHGRVPQSFSAPNSVQGTECAGSSRSRCVTASSSSPSRRCSWWPPSGRCEPLPRRFPRVRAATGRSPDRGAGALDQRRGSLVTVPLETALNGVPGLETMRSKSVLGLSSVVLVLDHGTDACDRGRWSRSGCRGPRARLPAVARPPVMLSPLSSLSRVMKIGLTSETLSQVEMTTLARWTVRPRLMAIPGVANVAIWGQRDRQFQVLVDPTRLRAHAITVDDVVKATRDAGSLQAGGFLDTPNQRLAITHSAAVQTARDLERTWSRRRNGATLRVGDVATGSKAFHNRSETRSSTTVRGCC